jgi:branched-chain amino acid aminotransferase
MGFIYGDAAFDATRTFNGRPFRLRHHVQRLYNSLRYLRIDPGIDAEEMERWSLEVIKHNYPLLPSNQDMWVMQRISRGVEGSEIGQTQQPTVLIESHVIPFARRSTMYRDGIRMFTPSVPRIPPRFMSPRAKTHNYLNMVLGDLEAQGTDPGSWAVLLDEAGNLTEGRGSNVFLVKDGVVTTPQGQFVLEGVTRGVVLELAAGLEVPYEERDLDLYDAYTADEAFLTSTSLCICPISSVNGTLIGDGSVPGPVTQRLMSAFSDLAGMDYVDQYLSHLP